MEKINQPKYNFTGFDFGNKGLAVLRIEVLNYTENGTRYSTEIGLELTADERIELITLLAQLGQNKNDD